MHLDHKILFTLWQHLFPNHARLPILQNQAMLGSKPISILIVPISVKDFKPDLLIIQDNVFLNI